MMNTRLKRATCALASVGLVGAMSGCGWPGRALRGYARAEANGVAALDRGGAFEHAPPELRGQVRFVFDDFGSLNTDELDTYAVPWKLATASLVRSRHDSTGAPVSDGTLRAVLAEYGLLTPRRIANWTGPQPRLDRPLGVVVGRARRAFPAVEIEIANLGCATCHAGALHGADGLPTGEAWLGLPNTSLDLSAYVDAVLAALTRELERPDTLLATVARLYPGASERELSTLENHVIPSARERLAARAERYGGLLPFENGGPGLLNGVGSLRFVVGVVHADARSTELAWTSPPDLNGTTLRRSLLVDGVYAPPGATRFGPLAAADVTDTHLDALAGITSLFVSSTQGISPAAARRAVPQVREIMRFVHALEPPRFPGPVDRVLAARGREVYSEACASCHGIYSDDPEHPRLVSHPNRFVAQDRMGTDPVRWRTVDSASVRLMGSLGYEELVEPLGSSGYVAQDLSGIWATAPYLHNGSVPTLWHLLHAEQRPERFWVGGHALDYELMGVAGELGRGGTYRYPDGYVPWSKPFVYDTREPGRSNRGHEFRTLSEERKRALLEYLKLL
jgi:mono/diheme cytochrome c family protein